ncbi:hypothetical protein M9H77_23050 [Catharanthus roseus]|uniref:Uncharacterized protein n=1 Tax=Catharanthus roseus TaxID=4058 RepID=A0ACC0ATF1_CATRO|nr:hypothetical protein M9H77_23050 [Catharanthus roseus]
MGVRLLSNRALVWCLAGIDYEMPKLDFNDLVLGFGPCPLSPIVALHISLHSGVEAVLMCLDSRRLPSCARNLYVSSSIASGLGSCFRVCSLVPRGTHIPYSAAVDLVASCGPTLKSLWFKVWGKSLCGSFVGYFLMSQQLVYKTYLYPQILLLFKHIPKELEVKIRQNGNLRSKNSRETKKKKMRIAKNIVNHSWLAYFTKWHHEHNPAGIGCNCWNP